MYHERMKRFLEITNTEGQAMLEIGTMAPDFTLPDQNGKMHTVR